MKNLDAIENLASANPKSLPFRFSFWLKHFSLLIWTICCLFLLAFLFFQFLPEAKDENSGLITIGLYCIIYIMTFWGIMSIIKAMGKFAVEDAVARVVDRKAAEELRKIRGQESDRISLDRVSGFIPDQPNERLSIPRLFNHIIGEARDRKFESGVVLMQPYREESMGELINASVLQKTAMQLGILGTFMGLIGAFSNLNFKNLDSSLEIISHSLKFSFSTSIAGLVAAIILGLLLVILRKKQEGYFQSMEQATSNLIALVRNADNKDYFLAEFQQINSSIDILEKQIYRQTQRIEEQTNEIKGGINRLGTAKSEFDEFLKGISSAEERFLTEMKDYHSILSPEEISKSLKESLDQAVFGVSASLNSNLTKSIERYGQLEDTTEILSKNLKQLEETTTEQLGKQLEIMKSSGEMISESSTLFKSSIEQIAASQEQFVEQITGPHVSEELKKQIIQASEGITGNLKKDIEGLRQFVGHLNSELRTFNDQNKNYLNKRLGFEKLKFRALSYTATGSIIVAILCIIFSNSIADFFSHVYYYFTSPY